MRLAATLGDGSNKLECHSGKPFTTIVPSHFHWERPARLKRGLATRLKTPAYAEPADDLIVEPPPGGFWVPSKK
jgi:hypothetical protein